MVKYSITTSLRHKLETILNTKQFSSVSQKERYFSLKGQPFVKRL